MRDEQPSLFITSILQKRKKKTQNIFNKLLINEMLIMIPIFSYLWAPLSSFGRLFINQVSPWGSPNNRKYYSNIENFFPRKNPHKKSTPGVPP